jgi:hypothetical protein
MDKNSKIMLAECYYNNSSYEKSIEILENIHLNIEKKFILIKAYIKSNNREKAKIELRHITQYSETNKENALKDPILKSLLNEILEEEEEEENTVQEEIIPSEPKETLLETEEIIQPETDIIETENQIDSEEDNTEKSEYMTDDTYKPEKTLQDND